MRTAATAIRIIMLLSFTLSAAGMAYCADISPKVVVSFQPTSLPPVTPRDDAVTLAVRYSGLLPSKVVSANYGLVTDTTIPYFKVIERTAWEVTFDAIELEVTPADGTKLKNGNVARLTALIDDSTGSLLKLSSPKPAQDSITLLLGSYAESELGSNGGTLQMTPTRPTLSFLQAFGTAGRQQTTAFLQAKEITAYFGLFSEPLRMGTEIKSRPYWVIILGGTKLPFPSLGGRSTDPRPLVIATEQMVVMDAETGVIRFVQRLGRATPPS